MTINYKKITGIILIDLIVISVLFGVYGFAFGGKPNLISNVPYTIFTMITLCVISIITYLYITKKAVGKNLPPYLFVGILFIAYFASVGIYNFENEFLSFEEPIKYESTVINTEQKSFGKSSRYVIYFNDSGGKLISVTDDYNAPKIGSQIEVEEIPGAFGYSVFYTTFETYESIL